MSVVYHFSLRHVSIAMMNGVFKSWKLE